MMAGSHDDVAEIQKRYSLTLINPSSLKISLVFSMAAASVLVAVTVFLYGTGGDVALRLAMVLPVLFVTQWIDSRFIRNKEISKAMHMSLFGNLLWLLTAFCGFFAAGIFAKPEISLFYIAEGMFLFASFRLGIYTTTLGSGLGKAFLVCFIQPIAIFLVLIPSDLWVPTLSDPIVIMIGGAFLAITAAWSYLTDRAGLPSVKSTHRLVQAYLFSVSKNDPSEVESIIEEQSRRSTISTSQIRLCANGSDRDFRIVLPGIHPGPYHPVGGSNIPYLIYDNFQSSAMVMHSISDHSFNLPSKTEVENYIRSISSSPSVGVGTECAEPVTMQVHKARTVGMAFGRTAMLFLSLSPHGMEDIPISIKNRIEEFAKSGGFDDVLIVDCHNAMGGEISENDSKDLLESARLALDVLQEAKRYPVQFGYANSGGMGIDAADLAMGGMVMLCLGINGKKYFLGWADANNMENGAREEIVGRFAKDGHELLEICTSDTHYMTGARNKRGYHQFGLVSKPKEIAGWYLKMAEEAEKNLAPAAFEVLAQNTDVKVMGPAIYRDYSRAVDRSMKITKVTLAGCTTLFLATMI